MLECSQISKGPVVQSTSSFDVFLVDTHKGQLIHLRSSSVSSRSFWKVQCLFLLDCRYVCFFLFYCLVSLFFQEIDSFIRHVVGNYAMISWAAPEGLLGTLYTLYLQAWIRRRRDFDIPTRTCCRHLNAGHSTVTCECNLCQFFKKHF